MLMLVVASIKRFLRQSTLCAVLYVEEGTIL